MPAIKLNKKHLDGVIVVKEMRDYSNEPFFKMKAEKAKAFIEKHGLPKSFQKKVDDKKQ